MIIELLDGTRFDISDFHLKRLFHRIPTVSIEHTINSVDGRPDLITKSKLNLRTISIELLYDTDNIYDFYFLRDQMSFLFVRSEPYYIIFKREPYKRYLVKLADGFSIEPKPNMNSFTVNFVTQKIYAESIFRTTQLTKEWDNGQYSWDSGIDWDSGPPQYVFNANEFTVNNYGNKTIDPREDYFIVLIRGNFNNFIRIRNLDTGDLYEYYRNLNDSIELRLDGIRTLRDGQSDFASTNRNLITLRPGINRFSIEGGQITSAVFDFRFLYK